MHPNIFNSVFVPWEDYRPELDVPFFCAKIDISSSACGRKYILNIIPRLQRIVIVQDGKIKRYTSELIIPKEDGKLLDGYESFDDFYQISKRLLVPDENVTCNCGHFNNKPIDAFPWDKFPDRYVTGSSFWALNNNLRILMKRMNIQDLVKVAQEILINRKNTINELLI